MRLLPSSLFVLATLVGVAPIARASPDERGAESWDDRRGTTWESGIGPSLTLVGARGQKTFAHAGATAVFGVHRMIRYPHPHHHEKGGDWPESEAMRWCMPIACAGIGLVFAPAGSLLGNELGVDLRATGAVDLARIGLRPIFHYSRGIFRTPSLVGVLVPEIAAARRGSADGTSTYIVVAWSLFPFDVRITKALSIGADPLRGGLMTDLGGGAGRAEIATEIAIRFAP